MNPPARRVGQPVGNFLMTYQVLARKWRPKRFADLVGQEHVVRALSNALTESRLHHAYLLTGTRGVGKTTIARILAKSLNCETGMTATPCGICSACQQIDGGRFVDLLEIDAASNTGIDNIREVLDNAQYAPSVGRFKVYIIDEVHMLSKSAFNAMLKTLEEPPAHVKFILATTDPQKVPVTVLSRCLQFSLRNMTPQQVSGHLAHVLDTEGVCYEPTALTLLGRAASGSMRDALSLLDQAIAYGMGEVREADVRAMLGAVDRSYLFALLAALAEGDGAGLMREAEDLAERGVGFESALTELAHVLYEISLAQTVPAAVADDAPEREAVLALAALIPAADVQLYYQIAITGKRDLALAPDEHAGFNMTLLRMLAFHPQHMPADIPRLETSLPAASVRGASPSASVPPSSAAARPNAAPATPAISGMASKIPGLAKLMQTRQSKGEGGGGRPSSVPPAAASAAASAPPPPTEDPEPALCPPWEDAAPLPAPTATPQAVPTAPAALPPTAIITPFPTPVAPVVLTPGMGIAACQGNWSALVEAVRDQLDAKARMLAQHTALTQVSENRLSLRLSAAFPFVATPENEAELAARLSDYLGETVRLEVTVGEVSGETPHMQQQRLRDTALAEAHAHLAADSVIQALQHHFEATVVAETVQPLLGA